jgi:DNA-binding MarR family transcriptional regulator
METRSLERYLTYKLHMLNKLSDRASHDAYLAGCGLPLGEARCMAAVGSFTQLTVNELAFEANLDKAQASRAAQALVERGLLRKQPNAQDARCVILSLTPAGQPVWEQVMRLIEQRNQDIFGELSPAERALLSELFDRLILKARTSTANPSGAS